MSNRIYYLLCGAILVIAFILRLYKFDTPLADWHSWRQTDTSSVSRMFVQNGFDVLHPTFNDLSNIPSGKDNPQGYRFVEFPIFNILQAGGFVLFNGITIEQWGRLVTILASLMSIILIFLIMRRFLDAPSGIIAGFLFAVLPFSIYYGRTVLPDQLMVTLSLASFYTFVKWIDTRGQTHSYAWYLVTLVISALAILVKPYALFFFLPHMYVAYRTFRFRLFTHHLLWILAIGSIIPFVLWRYWMLAFPEGIPANDWLFNGGDIRFKGAYFHWLYGERIGKLILGYFGVALLVAGILRMHGEKWYGVFISFLLSSFLYLSVIARGNVQHDYYQILIIPTLGMFCSRGVRFFWQHIKETGKIQVISLICIVVGLMLPLSWYHVRDYFNINNPSMIDAARQAEQMLPENAKVIAPFDGDTTFLYYLNRQGWPAFQHSTEELAQKGATHLILLNPSPDTVNELNSKYDIVSSSSAYIVVDLR